jgi:signal transduction histidine kinase
VAAGQVQALVADVRSLIYELRPPALDQLGLAGWLRGLASRESGVTVDAPTEFPELPAAVEVAAYWIAQEATTNVRRHARASTCQVRAVVEAGMLRLEVEDDGPGLGNGPPGLGLATMRERAVELGGTCEIGPSAAGGTRVVALLPCDLRPVGR